MKEIEKVNDINIKSNNSFELLIKEKDIIKKSNKIDLKNLKSNILKGDNDVIIKNINDNLDTKNEKIGYYLELKETLIYFFEKNKLIYLENKSLEGEPMGIFKDCMDIYIKKLMKAYI